MVELGIEPRSPDGRLFFLITCSTLACKPVQSLAGIPGTLTEVEKQEGSKGCIMKQEGYEKHKQLPGGGGVGLERTSFVFPPTQHSMDTGGSVPGWYLRTGNASSGLESPCHSHADLLAAGSLH